MKNFPECLNRLRRCVRVGLNSVGGRGKKETVAGYRSVVSFCRIVVVADFSYSIVGGEHQSFSVC